VVAIALRVSSAGACPRRIELEAWGVEGLPLWEGSERAFAEGNMHEQSILEWACENLPNGPYVLHSQQKEVSIFYHDKELLVGHIDGLATNNEGVTVLLEAKALAKRAFTEIREKGLREAHPQYFTQVQLYLHALGLEKGYLIVRNKDTPKTRFWDHHIEEVVYDAEFVEAELKRLEELAIKIEQGVEIEPPYNPEDNWQCRQPYCPYTEKCFPEYYKNSRQPKTAKVDMELSALVEQYVELGEEISEMQEIREGIKEQIMERVGSDLVIAGEYVVYTKERITETIDTKKVREVVPAEMLQGLMKVSRSQVLYVKPAAEE